MRKLELEKITFTENESKSYVIYGFGIMGRMLLKALSILNIKVDCFLCSDGYKKDGVVDGIKVYEFSEYIDNKNGIRKSSHDILISGVVKTTIKSMIANIEKYAELSYKKVISLKDFFSLCECIGYEYFLEA